PRSQVNGCSRSKISGFTDKIVQERFYKHPIPHNSFKVHKHPRQNPKEKNHLSTSKPIPSSAKQNALQSEGNITQKDPYISPMQAFSIQSTTSSTHRVE